MLLTLTIHSNILKYWKKQENVIITLLSLICIVLVLMIYLNTDEILYSYTKNIIIITTSSANIIS